mmetsp:Transcript_23917/g.58017  ORF Transcript_23917/g.58017 Transcript_23917/m.58017 type:complete len:840 (+) Transcript_23917:114-2633(+)
MSAHDLPRESPRPVQRQVSKEDLVEIVNLDATFESLIAEKAVFYRNLDMALRGGTAITCVVGIALIPGTVSSLPRAYSSARLLAMVGFWFVLTFSKHFGTTLRNAAHAMAGTLIATLNSLALNTICPGGAKNAAWNGYKPEIAWLELAVVIFIIMLLNMPDRTRTFAVFYIAMFTMHYMDPKSTAIFSHNFHLDVNGTGISYFMVCVVGTLLATLFSLVPWPHTFQAEVAVDIGHLRTCISTLLEVVGQSCNGVPLSTPLRSKCAKGSTRISGMLSELDEKLAGMWWEGFDTGSFGRVRNLFLHFSTLLRELMDIMHALLLAAEADRSHATWLMEALEADIYNFVDATNRLLAEVGEAVSDGHISKQERLRIEREAQRVQTMSTALSTTYATRRLEAGAASLDRDLLEEDYITYNLARIGESLVKFSLSLETPAEKGFFADVEKYVLDIFDPMLNRNHANFVIRSYVSFMLAFVISFYFYGADYLIPATVGLVLSKFLGSALERNLCRAQGTVLGLVLPAIILRQVPACGGGLGSLIFLTLVFVFIAVALYISQSGGARNGYIAMLTAAFAAQTFFLPCNSYHDHTTSSGSVYSTVSATIMGILIVSLVDVVLANERPTEGLRDCLGHVFSVTRSGFVDVLEGNPTHKRAALLKRHLDLSTMFHIECPHEPRLWRIAYPEQMVASILGEARSLRLDLHSLEKALYSGGTVQEIKTEMKIHTVFQDGVPDPVMPREVLECLEYRQVCDDLLSQYDKVTRLCHSVLSHESEGPKQAILDYDHRADVDDNVHRLAEVMEAHFKYEQGKAVLDDYRCRAAVIIFMIFTVHRRLDRIAEMILRS